MSISKSNVKMIKTVALNALHPMVSYELHSSIGNKLLNNIEKNTAFETKKRFGRVKYTTLRGEHLSKKEATTARHKANINDRNRIIDKAHFTTGIVSGTISLGAFIVANSTIDKICDKVLPDDEVCNELPTEIISDTDEEEME